MRSEFLVCYDIAHPKRLRRVHRMMKDYGDWLQYSVFSCHLSATDHAELQRRLLEVIDQRRDQVMFVRLGPSRRDEGPPQGSEVLGRAWAPLAPRLAVL